MIKHRYISFISQNLGKNLSESSSKAPVPQSNMGSNSLEIYKLVALRNASFLKRDIPEGEQILLSMIVNKIGDPSRKVAAAAAHRLRLILERSGHDTCDHQRGVLNYSRLNEKTLMIKFVLFDMVCFSFNHLRCLVSFTFTGTARHC